MSSRNANTPSVGIGRSSACSAETVMNSVISGYVAGVCGIAVGHPMDSVKVWMQTNTNRLLPPTTAGPPSVVRATGLKPLVPSGVARMSTLTVASTQSNLLRFSYSLRALYSGISVPLVSVGVVQSMNFAIYDSVRRILYKRKHPDANDSDYLTKDPLLNVALASSAAGVFLSVVTSPLLVIKTKQQLRGIGFRQAFVETVRPGGTLRSGAYVGFGAHFMTEVTGRFVYFVAYEGLKRAAMDENGEIAIQHRMLSAGLAGVTCWSVIFPFDSTRSRAYAQAHEGKSSLEIAVKTFRDSGGSIRPFYRGFLVTILRAGPVAAAVLPIYDAVLARLSK